MLVYFIQFLVLIFSVSAESGLGLANIPGCLPTGPRTTGFNVEFYPYPINNEQLMSELSYVLSGYKNQQPIASAAGITDVDFNLWDGSPGLAVMTIYGQTITTSNFTAELTGYFYAQDGGTYDFSLVQIDDSAAVFLGDGAAFDCCDTDKVSDSTAFVIFTSKLYDSAAPSTSAEVVLDANTYYPIRIIYSNALQRAEMNFQVTFPNGTVTSDFTNVYSYNNTGKYCPALSVSSTFFHLPTVYSTSNADVPSTTTTTFTESGQVVVEELDPYTTITIDQTSGAFLTTSTIVPDDGSGVETIIVDLPSPGVTMTLTWAGTDTETATDIVIIEVPTPTVSTSAMWTGTETETVTFTAPIGGTDTVAVEVPNPTPPSTWTNDEIVNTISLSSFAINADTALTAIDNNQVTPIVDSQIATITGLVQIKPPLLGATTTSIEAVLVSSSPDSGSTPAINAIEGSSAFSSSAEVNLEIETRFVSASEDPSNTISSETPDIVTSSKAWIDTQNISASFTKSGPTTVVIDLSTISTNPTWTRTYFETESGNDQLLTEISTSFTTLVSTRTWGDNTTIGTADPKNLNTSTRVESYGVTTTNTHIGGGKVISSIEASTLISPTSGAESYNDVIHINSSGHISYLIEELTSNPTNSVSAWIGTNMHNISHASIAFTRPSHESDTTRLVIPSSTTDVVQGQSQAPFTESLAAVSFVINTSNGAKASIGSPIELTSLTDSTVVRGSTFNTSITTSLISTHNGATNFTSRSGGSASIEFATQISPSSSWDRSKLISNVTSALSSNSSRTVILIASSDSSTTIEQDPTTFTGTIAAVSFLKVSSVKVASFSKGTSLASSNVISEEKTTFIVGDSKASSITPAAINTFSTSTKVNSHSNETNPTYFSDAASSHSLLTIGINSTILESSTSNGTAIVPTSVEILSPMSSSAKSTTPDPTFLTESLAAVSFEELFDTAALASSSEISVSTTLKSIDINGTVASVMSTPTSFSHKIDSPDSRINPTYSTSSTPGGYLHSGTLLSMTSPWGSPWTTSISFAESLAAESYVEPSESTSISTSDGANVNITATASWGSSGATSATFQTTSNNSAISIAQVQTSFAESLAAVSYVEPSESASIATSYNTNVNITTGSTDDIGGTVLTSKIGTTDSRTDVTYSISSASGTYKNGSVLLFTKSQRSSSLTQLTRFTTSSSGFGTVTTESQIVFPESLAAVSYVEPSGSAAVVTSIETSVHTTTRSVGDNSSTVASIVSTPSTLTSKINATESTDTIEQPIPIRSISSGTGTFINSNTLLSTIYHWAGSSTSTTLAAPSSGSEIVKPKNLTLLTESIAASSFKEESVTAFISTSYEVNVNSVANSIGDNNSTVTTSASTNNFKLTSTKSLWSRSATTSTSIGEPSSSSMTSMTQDPISFAESLAAVSFVELSGTTALASSSEISVSTTLKSIDINETVASVMSTPTILSSIIDATEGRIDSTYSTTSKLGKSISSHTLLSTTSTKSSSLTTTTLFSMPSSSGSGSLTLDNHFTESLAAISFVQSNIATISTVRNSSNFSSTAEPTGNNFSSSIKELTHSALAASIETLPNSKFTQITSRVSGINSIIVETLSSFSNSRTEVGSTTLIASIETSPLNRIDSNNVTFITPDTGINSTNTELQTHSRSDFTRSYNKSATLLSTISGTPIAAENIPTSSVSLSSTSLYADSPIASASKSGTTPLTIEALKIYTTSISTGLGNSPTTITTEINGSSIVLVELPISYTPTYSSLISAKGNIKTLYTYDSDNKTTMNEVSAPFTQSVAGESFERQSELAKTSIWTNMIPKSSSTVSIKVLSSTSAVEATIHTTLAISSHADIYNETFTSRLNFGGTSSAVSSLLAIMPADGSDSVSISTSSNKDVGKTSSLEESIPFIPSTALSFSVEPSFTLIDTWTSSNSRTAVKPSTNGDSGSVVLEIPSITKISPTDSTTESRISQSPVSSVSSTNTASITIASSSSKEQDELTISPTSINTVQSPYARSRGWNTSTPDPLLPTLASFSQHSVYSNSALETQFASITISKTTGSPYGGLTGQAEAPLASTNANQGESFTTNGASLNEGELRSEIKSWPISSSPSSEADATSNSYGTNFNSNELLKSGSIQVIKTFSTSTNSIGSGTILDSRSSPTSTAAASSFTVNQVGRANKNMISTFFYFIPLIHFMLS